MASGTVLRREAGQHPRVDRNAIELMEQVDFADALAQNHIGTR